MVPIDFQAACLYTEPFKGIDFDHFIETLTGIVAQEGHEVKITHRTDDALLILQIGTCNIKVDLVREPANAALFTDALQAPLAVGQPTNFSELIANHKEYVLLTAGSGTGIFNGEHLAIIAKMGLDVGFGETESRDEMELRLKVLHMTTLYLCTYAQPDMIHWTQSQQLSIGENYLKFIDDEFPLFLLMNPFLYAGDKPGEVTARFLGSEQVIGTRLMLNSTSLSIPDIVGVGLIMAEYCRAIDSIPEDGNTMGREEEWIAQVHKQPATEDAPTGITTLTILSHKNLDTAPSAPTPPQPAARPKAPRTAPSGAMTSEQALRDAYLNKASLSNRIMSKLNPFRKNS